MGQRESPRGWVGFWHYIRRIQTMQELFSLQGYRPTISAVLLIVIWAHERHRTPNFFSVTNSFYNNQVT